ncbi:MAG: TIGR01458 family HAD-type hydrolase [Acidimicrobiia bacterium]
MSIEGLLIDIDGVLVVSWQPLPGAFDALTWLRSSGLAFRFATNTTTRSRGRLAKDLEDAGFDIAANEIMTAPVATAEYLRRNHQDKTCFLIAKGDVDLDFDGIDLVEDNADVVVVGGAEERFTYEALDKAFRMLHSGAALVAMHRNLWWMTKEGPRLDAGAFIAGLEAATGVTAEVTGKPSRAFFDTGVAALGTRTDRTAMVGDDLVTDVEGAQTAGLLGVLVQTGKFEPEQLRESFRKPDHVISSIGELPGLIA